MDDRNNVRGEQVGVYPQREGRIDSGDRLQEVEREGQRPRGAGGGKLALLIAGPLLALLPLLIAAPAGLPEPAWRLVGLTAWMVLWWLSEVVPLAATALLPLPFMPLLGIAPEGETAANYANPIIFLFMGGFFIAAAMQRWGLHRRIALNIVRLIGTSPAGIVAGFTAATAFLSMWISNTATAVMMFAVGISLIDYLKQHLADRSQVRNFGVALMLSIAYGASIGGVGTLIGTPPNTLMASFLASTYGLEVSFARWMALGVPLLLVMLPLGWLWLTRVAFPVRGLELGAAGDKIREDIRALGTMNRGEKIVLGVFVATALAWMFRPLLSTWTGLTLSDTTVALIAATLLFAIPVSRREGFTLTWREAQEIPWGVLLLFGGGLALAGAFGSTGLAEAIGDGVSGLQGVSIWWVVLIVTAVIVFLTELTSNTATAATFLPIMGAVAVGLGQSPLLLVVPVAVAASMAFMMPVATPPNAIVFAYDDLDIRDMIRAGLFMNLLSITVIFLAMLVLAPLVFGM
ncbi:SLC13 family permease [Truepera radiovictrix]|uniref:Anion transporter n=1 Tax=Truepera radiovictrix (strain DSM 17093 / CIP 108686 / LMG 22925 / RQ-24) TaxID=649638 RepID=D7CU64_TRURR|nr:SLC13 family permease [Truepera radiovictrix]ADI13962.1 anion transporter [Truepera radiovictrix DSM 17093]WMT57474.1 SLC13 family permease [Truepera radiovictrix]